MKVGPAAAVEVLAKYVTVDHDPVAAQELLRVIIVGEAWAASSSEAYELAESWLGRFSTRLERLLSEQSELGRFCVFAFNSSDRSLIQGSCFVEPGDSPGLVDAKRRRLAHSEYLEALIGLTPTEFEWACRGMIREMGVLEPVVSRRSADDGIDFFGRWHLEPELRRAGELPSFYSTLDVWLVGQAKHYRETQAATPDIRELVGSVQLARARAFPNPESLPGLEIRVCDPVYYLFFTTGRISRDGWKLIKASGVIGMDGEMVADFLADHQVGQCGGSFSPTDFASWVADNAPA